MTTLGITTGYGEKCYQLSKKECGDIKYCSSQTTEGGVTKCKAEAASCTGCAISLKESKPLFSAKEVQVYETDDFTSTDFIKCYKK